MSGMTPLPPWPPHHHYHLLYQTPSILAPISFTKQFSHRKHSSSNDFYTKQFLHHIFASKNMCRKQWFFPTLVQNNSIYPKTTTYWFFIALSPRQAVLWCFLLVLLCLTGLAAHSYKLCTFNNATSFHACTVPRLVLRPPKKKNTANTTHWKNHHNTNIRNHQVGDKMKNFCSPHDKNRYSKYRQKTPQKWTPQKTPQTTSNSLFLMQPWT